MVDDEARRRNRFAAGLAVIGAGALAVRLAAVTAWYRHLPLGATDNYFYWAQARAVARGDGFVNPFEAGQVPSAAHPPLYSTYLAVFSRVGLDTPTQFRVASCLLGVATVVVIGIIARRIAGDRAGLLAAGFAAIFPPLWIADGTLVSESVYALTIALTLLAGHVFATRRDVRSAAALGLMIGLATLGRTEGIGLVVLLAWPLAALARDLPWRRRFALAGVATVATVGRIMYPGLRQSGYGEGGAGQRPQGAQVGGRDRRRRQMGGQLPDGGDGDPDHRHQHRRHHDRGQ